MSQIMNSSDRALSIYLVDAGLARAEHIAEAQRLQEQSAARGENLCLADALIRIGVITAVQREDAERKILRQNSGLEQLGNYKLLKKLGEGAMGCVFLAEDVIMRRRVALKVLQQTHSGDQRFIARFKREVRALAALSHPNIVTAYAVGEELGRNYFAMEYCEGSPLDGLLQRRGHLPVDEALEIIAQAARGLQHAHEHGLLHRDIKPANIFVRNDGVVKILDLGLSKNLTETDSSFNTQTGMILGTPHYIAPEQLRSGGEIDGRADIYSLGSTLYHLVTGNTPFLGTSMEVVVKKQLCETPPNPSSIRPDVPLNVSLVIRTMMAREPADRYADCAAALADLELLMAGKTPLCASMQTMSTAAMPAHKDASGAGRKRVPLRVYGATACAFILAVAALIFAFRKPATVNSPPPDNSQLVADNPAPPPAQSTQSTNAQVAPPALPAPAPPALPAPVPQPPAPIVAPTPQPSPAGGKFVYLSDLPVGHLKTIPSTVAWAYRDFSFGIGKFGLPEGNGPAISVKHVLSPHGLSMNVAEETNGSAHVMYNLDKKYKRFEAIAAINDTAGKENGMRSALIFKVLGDGKQLWISKPLDSSGQSESCSIDVSNVNGLGLEVDCPGDWWKAQGVWVEPRVFP